MNIREYIENQNYFNNDTKIAYFEIGYIINKLFEKMTQAEVTEFTKKELKSLDWKYLTKEKVSHKLFPKLTCLNDEYNLSQDALLSSIGQTILDTQGFETLSEDPALYIGLGLSIANKLSY